MMAWPWQLFRQSVPTPDNTQYVPAAPSLESLVDAVAKEAPSRPYEPVDRPITPEWWEFVGEIQRRFQFDPKRPDYGRAVEIAALAENFINKLAQRKEQEIAAMIRQREETHMPEQSGHFPKPPEFHPLGFPL